jgi:elongation factor G
MFGYVNQLRSFTQGRAQYTMQFSHYEEVPAHATQSLISAYQKSKGAEVEE